MPKDSKFSHKIKKDPVFLPSFLANPRPTRTCAAQSKSSAPKKKHSSLGRPKQRDSRFTIDPKDESYELAEHHFIYYLGCHLDAISEITEKPTDEQITAHLESSKCIEHQNYESLRKALFILIDYDHKGNSSLSKMKEVASNIENSFRARQNSMSLSNEEQKKEFQDNVFEIEKSEASQAMESSKEIKNMKDRIYLAYLFRYLARNVLKMKLLEDFFRIMLFFTEVLEENKLKLENLSEKKWQEAIIGKCLQGDLRFLEEYEEGDNRCHHKQLLKDLVNLTVELFSKVQAYTELVSQS